MRFVRARWGEKVVLARVDGSVAHVLAVESNHPAADVLRESLASGTPLDGSALEVVELADLHILAPLRNPGKIICVGLNYVDHAAESGVPLPSTPLLFSKFNTTLVGPGEPILIDPSNSVQVDYEAELAVVIGAQGRSVDESAAPGLVFGYTLANDISARDAQFADGQWMRGKSFDTFCPLGPQIVTPDEIGDVEDLDITLTLNGETLQNGSTTDMVFSVAELIAYCSRFFTLEPGDLILTGTPPGVGFARTPPVYLQAGDRVTVASSGIGELTNPVSHG